MEQLKTMKQCLMAQVQAQMAHLDCVDTAELGEAIDMIKDLEEAIYYASIVEAMEEATADERETALMKYYPTRRRRSSEDMLNRRRYDAGEMMYYTDDESLYHKSERVDESKRKYLKTKNSSSDKVAQMNSLEKYLQELASDMAEIIDGCTPEEKSLIHKKLVGLTTKLE